MWTLSQSYYFGSVNHNPAHRVALIDGTPIHQHDDLDAIWIGPGNADAAGTPDEPGDEREIAELVRRVLTGEEIHTTLCPLAARLIGRSVPPETTAEILRGIMLSYPNCPAMNDGGRGSPRSAAWFTAPAPNTRRLPQSGRNTAAPLQPLPAA